MGHHGIDMTWEFVPQSEVSSGQSKSTSSGDYLTDLFPILELGTSAKMSLGLGENMEKRQRSSAR